MERRLAVERLASYVRERWGSSFSFENMVKNLVAEEENRVAEAWNDGNFLGRNPWIEAPYSNGKQYVKYEHDRRDAGKV